MKVSDMKVTVTVRPPNPARARRILARCAAWAEKQASRDRKAAESNQATRKAA